MTGQPTLEEVRAMSDAPTIMMLFLTLVFVAIFSSCTKMENDY